MHYETHSKFKRIAPATFGELPHGWFVIRWNHVQSKTARRKAHGAWAVIQSDKGRIYRVARYASNLKQNEMVLDWVGWMDLQGRPDDIHQEYSLTVRKARWFDYPYIGAKHPDPAYRLSFYVALMGVGLGIVSLILSALSLR